MHLDGEAKIAKRALLAFLWINERLEAALPCAYAQSNCDSAT
jgi:hypothetical protein